MPKPLISLPAAEHSGGQVVLEEFPDYLASSEQNYEAARPELLRAAELFHAQGLEQIRRLNDTGVSGEEVVDQLTHFFDQLVEYLYLAVTADLAPASCAECAVLAVGGYGRAEMNPLSDLDLMFFYQPPGQQAAAQIADRMLYLLWDLGLDVGSSVRSLNQCLEEARDTTVRTALLDCRLLCGHPTLFDVLQKGFKKYLLEQDSQAFIRAKLIEREERQQKFGSSVYLLEPNLKEGEGGLRDLQEALWICRIKYRADSLRDLLIKGVITEEDMREYLQAQDYLWKIRNFLHFYGGRKSDRLTFELQQQIAEFLGYISSRRGSAVEQFMQDYYAQANQVEHLSTKMILRATEENNRPRNHLFNFLVRRNLEDGFYIIRGELRAYRDRQLLENPELMMTAFELAQKHEVSLCIDLKQLIRDHAHLINDRVRRSRAINDAFRRILRHPKGVGRTLRKMHHLQFLNAFIPEFRNIYCKVQFDLYHTYTVDTHTLFAVAEMEKVWQGVYAESQPFITEVANNIEKRELLLLALLFHDIGKGSGKDHSVRGAEMVPRIARRMRLNREDTVRLEFLVRHHLQMSTISQRRDLQDMKMIGQFAELMGMSENLRMLYLLTFADLKAVGPDIWTEWKGGLLRELYEKTYDVLEKKDFYLEKRSEKTRNRKRKVRRALLGEFPESRVNKALNSLTTRYLMSYRSHEIVEHLRLSLGRGRRSLAMKVEHKPEFAYTEVTLATIDSPGLFSSIAGVLAANAINILGAQIHTRKSGTVLDVLQVNSPVGDIVDKPQKWGRVEEQLTEVIEGRRQVAELIEKYQEPDYLSAGPDTPRKPNRVEIDNEISEQYTVIEIFAIDKVGLLYDITRTLKDMGLYIAVSKISTKVDQAVDVFYISDIFGQKIIDPVKIEELRATLLDRLS